MRAPKDRESRVWLRYAMFALFVSLYLLPFMRVIWVASDEGTMLAGAARIVHGQVFARDFFEVMGPGSFYLLAAFFKLFGVTFFASRVPLFLSSLGTALAMYFLSCRVCARYQILPLLILAATSFGGFWPCISHHIDSNFFALLSVICLVLWNGKRQIGFLIAAGALAGVTTCILQQKGILLFFVSFIWLWFLLRKTSRPWASLSAFAASFLGVGGLVLGYFWSQGALGSLVYANYTFPSHQYGAVNKVVYAQSIFTTYWEPWVRAAGPRWTLAIAAVLIVPFLLIAALPPLMLALSVKFKWRSITPEIALLWLCGCALWFSEFHRKDIFHLVVGSPLLIVLFVHILAESRWKLADLTLQLLLVISVCRTGFNCIVVSALGHSSSTRVGKAVVIGPDGVLGFLNDHTALNEEILVYPYYPMYYFLSATTNPTPYSFLEYGYNPPSQYHEVMDILDRQQVRYVVWDTTYKSRTAEVFPGMWPKDPKDLILEPYLESHYAKIEDFNGVLIMERRGNGDKK